MEENLVIVESPAKAKTIEKFLGKNFKVLSSYGHIRDLSKKEFGIDIKNNYKPSYLVPDDKKKIVTELKKETKKYNNFWLATDEDREGEAIAWHLMETLNLEPEKVKRIVFHEITKNAIQNAIKKPRNINASLVDAQQARRILDRIVGYELSPILWKKVKPALSAGRVQSVAVRLLVEREREILAFKSTSNFKITGSFICNNKKNNKFELRAELNKRFEIKKQSTDFLNNCINAKFQISNIFKKPSIKTPSAPFTTSTLQQEASRKLGFSVAQTMTIAQRLYEAGKITYMRTDSVNLSQEAINSSKNLIIKEFGERYLKSRQYKTKSKGAQEAHEAIRPTYLDIKEISGNNQEIKLYELIWKRTIASQMSDAELEKTSIEVSISNQKETFIATGEIIKFDGFLKVYIESTDDDEAEITKGLLPPLNKGQLLDINFIEAVQKYSHFPPRYTEASLVKKLEELGIGRPSTYAPTISTIQNRGYVIKEDRPGIEREYIYLILENNKIKEEKRTEITGAEKAKLFPNNIGIIVNDFLMENFNNIMNYNFTATVEKEFDDIAEGKIVWTQMIDKFYKSFHPKVEKTIETSQKKTGEKILGKDPETGKTVSVKIGRYGPVAQIGESTDEDKPKFAPLQKGQLIENITLEEALKLFNLPRSLGKYEGKEVIVGVGKFGPYIRHDNKFYSLKKNIDDPFTISLERGIELIEEKREKEKNKIIKKFENEPELFVLNGHWGPYISYKKNNYKISKNYQPSKLTIENCMEIINNYQKKPVKKNK
ncbi:MAG: type I DNA topoisomerase [Bacteroidales bacterium]|nr:type I DNA topoisomerase [Bacteroidales bacterium]